MGTRAVLVVVLALRLVAGKQSRVVGGQVVQAGQFPFVVLVRRQGYECSGSLITPQWVLTAGHCLERPDARVYWVLAGVRNGTAEQSRGGVEVQVHPQFSHVGDVALYDIALLRVSRPFALTALVNCVALSVAAPPYFGHRCVAVGFGHTSVKQSHLEPLLPPPEGRVVPRAGDPLSLAFSPMACRDFGDKRWQEPYQICSLGGRFNVTHLYVGDSGGRWCAAVCRVGVFSMLEGKRHHGEHYIAQVHTATSFFLAWILHHVPDTAFF